MGIHLSKTGADLLICTLLLLLPCGCGGRTPTPEVTQTKENQAVKVAGTREIIASNAFFYYKDLQAAERFYNDILGLETVADYGFAKILRLARASYLTLVDAKSGMHSADEPKTVAIALITDQLDEWYQYLTDKKVPMRSGYNPAAGRAHHGFVAYDSEGYYLEFERFNVHPENERLLPLLATMQTIYPKPGSPTQCPGNLGFKATVLWLYYRNMDDIQKFWGEVMGFPQVVDQGWAKIYVASSTGFIGPVDGARGMHSWTEKKAVTVSFITENLNEWFGHLQQQKAFSLSSQAIGDEERAGARVFFGSDPEGYILEFDTFLDGKANGRLLQLLREKPSGN